MNLFDVPDPRGVAADLAKRLTDAWKTLCKRKVHGLVPDALMDCHTYEIARKIAKRQTNMVCQSRGEAG